MNYEYRQSTIISSRYCIYLSDLLLGTQEHFTFDRAGSVRAKTQVTDGPRHIGPPEEAIIVTRLKLSVTALVGETPGSLRCHNALTSPINKTNKQGQ